MSITGIIRRRLVGCFRLDWLMGRRWLDGGSDTLDTEPGTSLRAAGWKVVGEVRGRSWDTRSRPRLLDLFCGAGGAGMGYSRAGFGEIVGVDNREQKNYPFEFVLGDALEYLAEHGQEFDVIHASPPCQFASRATAWRGRREDHTNLITATCWLARMAVKPYIVENVEDARGWLNNPLMLCGSMFGIPVRSHRYFETFPWGIEAPRDCEHRPSDCIRDHGGKQSEAVFRAALECDWMTVKEARQAIPPAYTEYIGAALLRAM